MGPIDVLGDHVVVVPDHVGAVQDHPGMVRDHSDEVANLVVVVQALDRELLDPDGDPWTMTA